MIAFGIVCVVVIGLEGIVAMVINYKHKHPGHKHSLKPQTMQTFDDRWTDLRGSVYGSYKTRVLYQCTECKEYITEVLPGTWRLDK